MKRFQKNPKYSKGSQIVKNFKGLLKISKIPKVSKRFKKNQKDSKRFLKIPTDSKRIANDSKEFIGSNLQAASAQKT